MRGGVTTPEEGRGVKVAEGGGGQRKMGMKIGAGYVRVIKDEGLTSKVG
jgi:hypothetical protein